MRILETCTGQFVEIDPLKVEYAILSHTWSRAGEQSYQDVVRLQESLARRKSSIFLSIYAEVSWRASFILFFLLHLLFIAITTGHLTGSFLLRVREPRNTRLARELERCVDWLRAVSSQCRPCETILEDCLLSTKIRMACAVARAHGHLLLWIDSCCIDKTSSSELSEAINSMYLWYRHASVCYAYLADVPSRASALARDRAIRRSKWFTRGWTLQELIAPRIVVFLSSQWTFLGSRFGMAGIVAQITAIDLEVLAHEKEPQDVSVASRMSWAADRETTRVEDQAYALLGIFGIHMQPMYGEGGRAFIRLQEEILKRIPDATLFAWGERMPYMPLYGPDQESCSPDCDRFSLTSAEGTVTSLLASSPSSFRSCARGQYTPLSQDTLLQRLGLCDTSSYPMSDHMETPHGTRILLPLIAVNRESMSRFRPRPAFDEDQTSYYLAILAYESRQYPGCLMARPCLTRSAVVRSRTIQVLQQSYAEMHRGRPTSIKSAPPPFCIIPIRPSDIEHYRPHLSSEMVYIRPPTISTSFLGSVQQPVAMGVDGVTLALSDWSAAVLRAQGYSLEAHPARCSPDAGIECTGVIQLSKGSKTITIEYTWYWNRRTGTILPQVQVNIQPTHVISTASLSHRDPLLPLIRPGKRVGGQRSSTSFTFNSVGEEEVFVRVSLETRLRSPSEWLLDVEVLTGASAKALISRPSREGQRE
ncbi:hypothetical protein LXA43DRAFT_315572 [Ganoderma leucocontextum]|nr:hypothetical protein LXA43DRAFT_315572 [Ganoderma leucocontextum]